VNDRTQTEQLAGITLIGYGISHTRIQDAAREVVDALDKSQSLATPAMRQCVSALTNIPNGSPGRGLNGKNVYLYFHSSDHAEAFFRSIDALLAEEAERAPKPRWVVVGREIRRDGNAYGFCSFETEQQAEAVADCLNRLEGGGK